MRITVPDSLADLTVETFMRFHAATDEVGQIAALCGIEEDLVKRMDVDSLARVMDVLLKFENEDIEDYELRKIIKLDGEEYGFHPNLDSMTLGEFIDLEKACEDVFSTLPSAMCILYRKVNERYENSYSVHPYDPEADLAPYKTMTMDVAFGALSFFLRLGLDFTMTLARSLEQEKEALQAESSASGGGTPPSITSQGGMFSRLKQLLS